MNPHPVAVGAGDNRRAAWSPDGMFTTFSSDRDGDYEIYKMDALNADDPKSRVAMTDDDSDSGTCYKCGLHHDPALHAPIVGESPPPKWPPAGFGAAVSAGGPTGCLFPRESFWIVWKFLRQHVESLLAWLLFEVSLPLLPLAIVGASKFLGIGSETAESASLHSIMLSVCEGGEAFLVCTMYCAMAMRRVIQVSRRYRATRMLIGGVAIILALISISIYSSISLGPPIFKGNVLWFSLVSLSGGAGASVAARIFLLADRESQ